jgi:5-formyltetrahydrofolate cyclo-ligase
MTTPITSAKSALRLQVRERLRGMTPQQREAASVQICARLPHQAVWKSAGSILFFAPMPTEPDVWPLLLEALSSGKRVALPRFDKQAGTYAPALIENPDRDLVVGKLGIREPGLHYQQLPGNQVDLVLVPGVAFDLSGRRLGRGKGFYDRLLRTVSGTKCGVAFDQQIVAGLPAEPHDYAIDCILTPTRWIEC